MKDDGSLDQIADTLFKENMDDIDIMSQFVNTSIRGKNVPIIDMNDQNFINGFTETVNGLEQLLEQNPETQNMALIVEDVATDLFFSAAFIANKTKIPVLIFETTNHRKFIDRHDLIDGMLNQITSTVLDPNENETRDVRLQRLVGGVIAANIWAKKHDIKMFNIFDNDLRDFGLRDIDGAGLAEAVVMHQRSTGVAFKDISVILNSVEALIRDVREVIQQTPFAAKKGSSGKHSGSDLANMLQANMKK